MWTERNKVCVVSENKYAITHAARIMTVQDGVIRTTSIGTLADLTHALLLCQRLLA